MVTTTNTFTDILMAEDSDWYALPGRMKPTFVIGELANGPLEAYICDEGPIFCPLDGDDPQDDCPRCKGSGMVMSRVFLRDLAREVKAGWVRPAVEGDNVPHLDGWYMECEADHPQAEPAMILRL